MRSRGLGFWRILFCNDGPAGGRRFRWGPSQVQTCNVVSLADDRGEPGFLWKKAGGEHQGGRVSSSLDPPFLVVGTLRGSAFFFLLTAAHNPTPVTARPPAGRAGAGWFRGREEFFPPPKPSPWEGAPVRTLGRMRGRSCNQPFLVEKGVTDSRLDVLLLMPRWATRSPSSVTLVTASPKGKPLGRAAPTRKKRPKSGHVHGPCNSLSTGTMHYNRQNERARASGP